MILTGFSLALERRRQLVKPILVSLLLLCAAIEIISNRHFYDVLGDRLALDSESGWYRSRLFAVAVRELPRYWMLGFGMKDPGWGAMIDERPKTDCVNDYVLHASVYGVFGLAAYVSVLVVAMRNVTRSQKDERFPWRRSAAWALGSALVGLMITSWTVSIFTQLITVLYSMFALTEAVRLIPSPSRAVTAPNSKPASAPRRPVQPADKSRGVTLRPAPK
jgi:hypothetical protein